MARYVHIASKDYQHGQPLRCWNNLLDDGVVSVDDWKWSDADQGTDGDVVCMFDLEDEDQARDAAWHFAEAGGTILAVDLGAIGADEAEPCLTYVAEGYPAVVGHIPASCLTVRESL